MISKDIIEKTLSLRSKYFENNSDHDQAFRLFNGYLEGFPGLVIELFADTLVIFYNLNYEPSIEEQLLSIGKIYLEKLPWISSILLKCRKCSSIELKRGKPLLGDKLPDYIKEKNTYYAIDLRLNQDASFYIDTRLLREWLSKNSADKSILNTFAYTGSYGTAALSGTAQKVIQTDINKRFLNIASRSYNLNHYSTKKNPLITSDFFKLVSNLKHQDRLFDMVILDPPYFSSTSSGRISMNDQTLKMINKVRPLVAHDGNLIIINNALFVSGKSFMGTLEQLCSSDYVQYNDMINVPDDITGLNTGINKLPADPAPFNHATKIAILSIKRKDKAKAQ